MGGFFLKKQQTLGDFKLSHTDFTHSNPILQQIIQSIKKTGE